MNETSQTERRRRSAGRRAEDRELERRVEERTRELTALLEISRAAASTLDLEVLLGQVLDQLHVVAPFTSCGVLAFEGEELRGIEYRGPLPRDVVRARRVPFSRASYFWRAISHGEAAVIEDIFDDSPLARGYRAANDEAWLRTVGTFIRAWLAVPLMRQDEVIGAIVLTHDTPGYYTARHAELAMAIATQVAAAIENAELYAQTEQRTRELSTLLEVTESISSTLALEPLLDLILEQLLQVMPYRGASIVVLRDGVLETLRMRDSLDQERAIEQIGVRLPLEHFMPIWQQVQRGELVLIGDVRREDDPNAAVWRAVQVHLSAPPSPVRAWVAAPLSVRGEVFGILGLSRDVADSFTDRDVAFASAFAGHAAIAIQNARLHDETEQRTHELTTLLEVTQSIGSTLALNPLLDQILEQLLQVMPYRGASIAVMRDGALETLLMLDSVNQERADEQIGFRVPLERCRPVWEAVQRGEPVLIGDVRREDDPNAALWRDANGTMSGGPLSPVRAWLAAPLAARGEVFGLLAVSRDVPDSFTDWEVQVAMAFAGHAAVALQNASLHDETEQRTRELASLLEVSQNLAATLDLDALLDVILEQIKVVAECDGALISTFEGESVRILRRDAPTPIDPDNEQMKGVNPLSAGLIWLQLHRGEPVIIGDVRGDEPLAEAYRNVHRMPVDAAHLRDVRSWMAVPLMVKEEVIGFISIMRGEPNAYGAHHAQLVTAIATQAAAAIENARLHAQTQQRARELATLLEVSRAVASTLELTPLLNLVLEQLKTVVDYRGATVMMVAEDELLIAASRAVTPERETDRGLRVSLGRAGPIWDRLNRGEIVIITDVRGVEPAAVEYRSVNEALMDAPSHRDIRSWMAVPLIVGDRAIGMISASQDVPGYFTAHHGGLARAVADQAAVAIENARLYEEEHRTSLELGTLLDTSRNVSATLELEPLLGQILDQLKLVVEYVSAGVVTREGDRFRTQEYRGPLPREIVLSRPLPREMFAADTSEAGVPADTRIILDIWDGSPEAREYLSFMGEEYLRTVGTYVRCVLSAPLISKGRLIGSLVLTHDTPGFFTSRHAALVRAIADQATVAIENARLYEEAHKLAALEERQRLARELHDSVSQALFGIALGARTARRRLDQDPPRVGEALDYVLSLAEAGLTEMRALIFELRPEALEKDGLVVALTRHAAATRARHEIAVELDLCEEPDVPLATKEALYRIAQEAMHNTVKHARASRIDLILVRDRDGLLLDVRDDGAGFDPNQHFAGHLGLYSMRERMMAIGGSIELESAPGAGTRIRATVP